MELDNQEIAKLWKLETSINKMVLDGVRDPKEVADILQKIIEPRVAVEPEQKAKFGFVKDLGVVVVPKGYKHPTALGSFKEEDYKKFNYYNDNITDEHFPNPTRILKPGDRLRVKIFEQTVSGSTTSEERLAFLKSQKAILVGAQGSSLVFKQKRNQLPKGFWYASFDEKERLWEDSDGGHRVPSVYANSDGGFWFDLGYFEYTWGEIFRLLCFCEE